MLSHSVQNSDFPSKNDRFLVTGARGKPFIGLCADRLCRVFRIAEIENQRLLALSNIDHAAALLRSDKR